MGNRNLTFEFLILVFKMQFGRADTVSLRLPFPQKVGPDDRLKVRSSLGSAVIIEMLFSPLLSNWFILVLFFAS